MKRGWKIARVIVSIVIVLCLIILIVKLTYNKEYINQICNEPPICYIESTNQTCYNDVNCFYWFPKAISVMNTCNLDTQKCENLLLNITDEEECINIGGILDYTTCSK